MTRRANTTEQPTTRRRGRRIVAGLAAGALGAALVTAATASGVSAKTQPSAAGGIHDVVANLFEWNWNSVATECSTVLGPKGYSAVQVAPPQDSVKRTALGNGSDTILHPWWEVYQPVDYNLTSRMGNEAEFKAMVTTCRAAGVKVIVDAVINHMTGQGNLSYGGVSYTKYNYPGLYTASDFHKKGVDCRSASGGIEDFNNLLQVRKCELVGLSDLKTETPAVRTKLVGYLNKLISYGVSGFRIDAAKHIGQPDLAAIESGLHSTMEGTRPYVAVEVFGGGPGVLSPFAFQNVGDLLGLDTDVQLKSAFKSYPTNATGSIATLKTFGAGSGLVPHELSFVQNHDTERNGDALNYKDGATNLLANEFLLAYGYGRPEVYSGFTFTTSDDSPPSDANGMVTDTDCAGAAWACVDRDHGVANMVGWHNAVGTAPVANWWDDSQNLISFSRGDRGWIAINNATTAKTIAVQTGLAAGRYCDIIHGDVSGHTCSGTTYIVRTDGKVLLSVPAKDSVAFAATDRVS